MEVSSKIESGNQIALFAPHQLLIDSLSGISTIHIYRQDGLQNWSRNLKPIDLNANTYSTKTISHFDLVLDRLRCSEPIFARHYENLSNLEKAYREIAIITLALANDLAENRISVVVFPTTSSHHLDSLVMEIACQINRIPQVFQFIPVVANRCLPMIQRMSILDRKLLKLEKQNGSFVSWQSNMGFDNWRAPLPEANSGNSNLYRSILTISIYAFRTKFRKFRKICSYGIRRLFHSKIHVPKKEFQPVIEGVFSLRSISLREDIRLMNLHKISIKKLESYISKDAKLISELLDNQSLSSGKLIAIAANYQPEATTFPEAGKIYNFVDLVITIRSLGFTTPILYKEHPVARLISMGHRSTRCGVSRSTNYYSILKSLGVYFLDSDFDLSTTELVMPLTLNGSIAVERSLRGLSTIVVGSPWFVGMPGTWTLEDFIGCGAKIPLNSCKDTASLTANFINEIMKSSIAIDPILFGNQITNPTQISNFIEEYKNFLLILQKI
jgi:hypothetical protein